MNIRFRSPQLEKKTYEPDGVNKDTTIANIKAKFAKLEGISLDLFQIIITDKGKELPDNMKVGDIVGDTRYQQHLLRIGFLPLSKLEDTIRSLSLLIKSPIYGCTYQVDASEVTTIADVKTQIAKLEGISLDSYHMKLLAAGMELTDNMKIRDVDDSIGKVQIQLSQKPKFHAKYRSPISKVICSMDVFEINEKTTIADLKTQIAKREGILDSSQIGLINREKELADDMKVHDSINPDDQIQLDFHNPQYITSTPEPGSSKPFSLLIKSPLYGWIYQVDASEVTTIADVKPQIAKREGISLDSYHMKLLAAGMELTDNMKIRDVDDSIGKVQIQLSQKPKFHAKYRSPISRMICSMDIFEINERTTIADLKAQIAKREGILDSSQLILINRGKELTDDMKVHDSINYDDQIQLDFL